jgi:PIN domain nuclease of toxin-antitoxin system
MGHAARALADAAIAAGDLGVSVISFWEVALLATKGRLRMTQPLAAWRRDLIKRGIVEIPLGGSAAIAAVQLQDFHADPADRLIVATAREIGATLVTADRRILSWSGRLDRRDARA